MELTPGAHNNALYSWIHILAHNLHFEPLFAFVHAPKPVLANAYTAADTDGVQ